MTSDEMHIAQAVIIGSITGAFSAGATWTVLKMELKWLRRDVNRILKHLFDEDPA